MPNFRFVGFQAKSPNGVVDSSQTQILSLADFYDPTGALGYTVIHIAVNTVWCGPSNEEADYIAGHSYAPSPGFAKELAPLGVVFLEVLTDGPVVGQAATIEDLRTWVSMHQTDYSVAVDGDYGSLGSLFDGAAIPFNIDIDARSMEILSSELGFNTALDTAIKTWIDWESVNPPK